MITAQYRYFFIFLSAVISSALCYFFGTGFNNVWILAWLAPFPILLFGLYARKTWHVLMASFLTYSLGSLNIFYYFHYLPTFIFMPIFISSSLVFAFFFSVIIFISCYVIKSIRSGWSVFFFPCFWICYEYAASHFLSSGTLISLAYSQIKCLPLLQIASISGIWGISFILALIPSSLAVAWYRRKDKYALFISLFFPACIVLLALSFGIFRLSHVRNTDSIKVGLLAAPESFHNIMSSKSSQVKLTIERFLQEVPNLKKQGADIIVMPEKIATTQRSYHNDVLDLFKNAARKNHVMLVFGINQLDQNKKFNTAYVVSKDGSVVAEYYKQHLLPGPETGYVVGNRLNVFSIRNHHAGIIICKDADFINPALQYSQKNIGLLFIPAMDFVVDGWLHAVPAIMRGVEGGYSVVRSAQWGLLTVTDPYGRVLGEIKTSSQQAVSILVSVPIYSGKTFYSKYSDWLIVLAAISCILLLAVSVLQKPISRNKKR